MMSVISGHVTLLNNKDIFGVQNAQHNSVVSSDSKRWMSQVSTVNPVMEVNKTTYTICVDKIVGDIVWV